MDEGEAHEATNLIETPDNASNNNLDDREKTDMSERSGGHSRAEGEEAEESDEVAVDAEILEEELRKILVFPPLVQREVSEVFDPSEFPESYKENLPKEQLVNEFAENFRRQFVHLYRDRKPLLLSPINECGVNKFVCTSVVPTEMPYKEVYDWQGAAEFVADYLNFSSLDPPYELPMRILSPATVLKRQKGNSFEYSMLLTSLLLGTGYDAYVVSGYATREMCFMDETRETCPLLVKKEAASKMEEEEDIKKYSVKPPKDLTSRFERKMENRRIKKERDDEEKKKKEEEEAEREAEKPAPDELHGLRIHSWVLVLEGKREVPHSFFLEPFTGVAHDVKDVRFLGIEAVWNHQNCWVNMQDCSEGVGRMSYDLGDCSLWEYVFPSNEKPILLLPEEEKFDDLDDEEDEQDIERHLDLPPSWCLPIQVSLRDYSMRCPEGKKTKLYRRAKLEKFAHYLLKDGLSSRLTVFEDRQLSEVKQTIEFYKHRSDKLHERSHNHRTSWISEHFYRGRGFHVKEHQYKASATGPESDRTMFFFHEARVDGLEERTETPLTMSERFKGREDYLYYRFVEFTKRTKKFGPQAEDAHLRPIQKMVEKYHRNPNIEANDDIAELIYHVTDDRIVITYHTEDDRVSASTREFIKPQPIDDKAATITWQPENHSTFQVDLDRADKRKVELYQFLLNLMEREEKMKVKVRESETEVRNILNQRTEEEAKSELMTSEYNTLRNDKVQKHRLELERLADEEKKRREDMEIDYLAPFLAQLGDPEKISRSQAFKLKEDCLADLKQRLIDKANLIQTRFEQETRELQKKQAWYQQNQVSMSKDDEMEYLSYCSEAMFRINILELRLNRHKELAPQKYMELEQKLRSDVRFTEFF